MTTSPVVTQRENDEKGVRRLGLGAGLGFAGALLAIVIPLLFLFLVADFPGGFFVLNSQLVQVSSILVLAGSILLLLSLFVYRRGFAALRKTDPRFYAASVLCIVGSIGFLLLFITAAIVVGNSSGLLSCAGGHPSHALSCLESGQPLGAVTGTVGFLLGWIGGVGIMLGLFLAGSRFRNGSLSASGGAYGILLLILIVPFLELVIALPDASYLLVIAPVMAIMGPGLALEGCMRTNRRLAPA
ncbi:MAG: hypothetical protein WBF81_02825 [Thermoplasmata archaeon]